MNKKSRYTLIIFFTLLTLGIGEMNTGIVDIKGEKLLIFNVGSFQIGILIEHKASARFTISEVNGILDEEFNRGE